MIEARDLTKFYGDHQAVEDVSFFVGARETVGFLGPNGAGKSTTMRMLTGFLAPTRGSARINGIHVQTNPLQARQQLGYLPESTPLYREMRVREFLAYRASLKGLFGHARRKAVTEALGRARVEHQKDRIIGHLSKGYRQRVGLAECLLGRPPLLILDEPTVGLDPNQVLETRNLVAELATESTVFLSTHILHEVEMVCQRVLIIDNGRIVAEGETATLCNRFGGERTLTVQLLTDEKPRDAMSQLEGVTSVTVADPTPDGAREFTLTCASGSDPRHAIARLVAQKNWLLQEMRLHPVRLDQIFADLTMQTITTPTSSAQPPAASVESPQIEADVATGEETR